tara:strand:+ start:3839 stop:4144 length:306 start_codon:yes stop_codon:yes gene_type:complete
MLPTESLIWIVLAGTGFVCVVSMLGVFSSIMRHETDLHNLRNRVAELQYSYSLQLARLHGHLDHEDEVGEVDILDDDGSVIEAGEPVEPLAPAGAPAARAA